MSSFMSEFKHLMIPLETIRNATNNFGKDNFIAEGGYGKVYRGEFLLSKGQFTGAVKCWSLSNQEGDPEFRREIMLLSDNKHENLISLLGFCYENKERILVYEYAPNKSLDFHIQDPNFTWIQRLKICLGAARGLEYLHNPKGAQRVLHCDIKSGNILLDENWNAKIADFGLSKYGPANQNRSYLITQAKGTPGYADPAFVETMIYTKESDVYSFGVVLLEVLCSRFCFDPKYNDSGRSLLALARISTNEEIRDTVVDLKLRQQMDEDSFDTFVTVAQECLQREQKARPSMDLVVKKIETALEYQIAFQALLEEEVDDATKMWSSGKEGDLCALLSTLQDILGPESGWEPVLVQKTMSSYDVMDLYQKAVYCVRYGKQETGEASIPENNRCGKVLIILREGLIRFTSEERILREKCDAEIKRWSSRNEGDFRGLLLTLQNILSGWQPVSAATLYDFRSSTQIYNRFLNLTNPHKLNKEGVSKKKKYLYGEVREIVEDAKRNLFSGVKQPPHTPEQWKVANRSGDKDEPKTRKIVGASKKQDTIGLEESTGT